MPTQRSNNKKDSKGLILTDLLNSDKAAREKMSSSLVKRIEDGDIDALLVHIQLKMLQDLLDRLLDKKKSPELSDRYKRLLDDELAKYPKSFEMYNAKISVRGGKQTYDWDSCCDPILKELNEEKIKLLDKIDSREKFLKSIPNEGIDIVIDSTGEVLKIYPPIKTQPDQIVVTLR